MSVAIAERAQATHEAEVSDTRRILLVDDDRGIRDAISGYLSGHGYQVVAASDVAAMQAALAAGGVDLIVLDVMMPGEDGLSALRRLAAQPDFPPVIMLSALGADIDRIVGLELGAEDYLAKPCNPRELLARIRTVLRRRERGDASERAGDELPVGGEQRLVFAGWTLDLIGRVLRDPRGVLINLSDGEFRLLRALVERPRRVLSRDQLLDWARGEETESYDRAIDVQLSRLRRKLSRGEGADELIRTVRNEGYMFMAAVTRG